MAPSFATSCTHQTVTPCWFDHDHACSGPLHWFPIRKQREFREQRGMVAYRLSCSLELGTLGSGVIISAALLVLTLWLYVLYTFAQMAVTNFHT